MRAGPTQVMRAEHIEIRDWMRAATDAIGRADGEVLQEALEALSQRLAAHNMKGRTFGTADAGRRPLLTPPAGRTMTAR